MNWLKKLIGNWWVVGAGKPYYGYGFVPKNHYRKMVLEPYKNVEDCQKRCAELNTPN